MELGDDLIYSIITLAVFFAGFSGIRQQVIFSTEPEEVTSTHGSKSTSQYAKSSSKKEQLQALLKRLLEHMENNQPFLDGKLTLS